MINLDEEDEQEVQVQLRKKHHPPKVKDPGWLTLPCVINYVDIGRAMIDSGSSINMMPLSYLRKLKG